MRKLNLPVASGDKEWTKSYYQQRQQKSINEWKLHLMNRPIKKITGKRWIENDSKANGSFFLRLFNLWIFHPPSSWKENQLSGARNEYFFHLGHLNRRRCHAVDYDDSSMMNRKLAQRSASIEKVMIFFLFSHFRWIARFPDVLAFSLVYICLYEQRGT